VAAFQASGLKERLLFTIGAVTLYRFLTQVPIWGVNPVALKTVASNQLLGFLDLFSGGALSSLSILALGISPYITSSIVMQLLTAIIPRLEQMQKDEGEGGRRKLAQITRYVSVGVALMQSIVVLRLFTSVPNMLMPGVEPALFYPLAVLGLVGGAMFAVWLSELITERGVGNGSSILIFIGILAGIPFYAQQTAQLVDGDPAKSFGLVILLLIYLVTIGLIVFLNETHRKVYIVQAKRQVGKRLYGGHQSYIPFKINPSGVMPIIFTYMLLAFPQTVTDLIMRTHPTGWLFEAVRWYKTAFTPNSPLFILTEFALIIFFSYFYATLVPALQPKEIASQLKRSGSVIPGVKLGKETEYHLDGILTKITLIGALFLGVITLVASAATSLTGIVTLAGLGSTALIIMVGVAMDTMNQIRVHLLVKQYEGFLKP
jgi:preprotein translocase subunit SecY